MHTVKRRARHRTRSYSPPCANRSPPCYRGACGIPTLSPRRRRSRIIKGATGATGSTNTARYIFNVLPHAVDSVVTAARETSQPSPGQQDECETFSKNVRAVGKIGVDGERGGNDNERFGLVTWHDGNPMWRSTTRPSERWERDNLKDFPLQGNVPNVWSGEAWPKQQWPLGSDGRVVPQYYQRASVCRGPRCTGSPSATALERQQQERQQQHQRQSGAKRQQLRFHQFCTAIEGVIELLVVGGGGNDKVGCETVGTVLRENCGNTLEIDAHRLNCSATKGSSGLAVLTSEQAQTRLVRLAKVR